MPLNEQVVKPMKLNYNFQQRLMYFLGERWSQP